MLTNNGQNTEEKKEGSETEGQKNENGEGRGHGHGRHGRGERGGHRDNRRGDNRPSKPTLFVPATGEVKTLIFIETDNREGQTQREAIECDGARTKPSLMWNPDAGVEIECKVFYNRRGDRGVAFPTAGLEKKQIIADLTFVRGREGDPIAFYRERAVLPAEGVKVSIGQTVRCLIYEVRAACFAQPLPEKAQPPKPPVVEYVKMPAKTPSLGTIGDVMKTNAGLKPADKAPEPRPAKKAAEPEPETATEPTAEPAQEAAPLTGLQRFEKKYGANR